MKILELLKKYGNNKRISYSKSFYTDLKFFNRASKFGLATSFVEDILRVENVDLLVERITQNYQRKSSMNHTKEARIWEVIDERVRGDCHGKLMSGELGAIKELLNEPIKSNLFYGFENICLAFVGPSGKRVSREDNATIVMMHLHRLAETVGAIPFVNPENFDKQLSFDAEDLLQKIETVLGVPLTFPNIFLGEAGLQTSKGIISYRSVQAIGAAYKIHKILKDHKNPRVLEIGAGLGRTAYYCRKLFSIKDYTLVDIPLSSVSQAYFLGHAFGQENIAFDTEQTEENHKFKIWDPQAFFRLDNSSAFDLIFNMDSLPEIDGEIFFDYLEKIPNVCQRFFSINHESFDRRVNLLCERESRRLASYQRALFPLRSGYLEELFCFKKGSI